MEFDDGPIAIVDPQIDDGPVAIVDAEIDDGPVARVDPDIINELVASPTTPLIFIVQTELQYKSK